MSTQVALLRGVNVGGKTQVAMPALRARLAELGFGNPRTLLQSGNAVFESADLAGAALEARLEDELERLLGWRVAVRVRSAADWARVVAHNPFPEQAKADPGHLLVMFLKAPPTAAATAALQAAIRGSEAVKMHGREAYVVFPDGIGRSKLTPALMEKHLGAGGTGRNWNTVMKLAAMTAP
jgi:uncharacterized protein (DUF1697 family)